MIIRYIEWRLETIAGSRETDWLDLFLFPSDMVLLFLLSIIFKKEIQQLRGTK